MSLKVDFCNRAAAEFSCKNYHYSKCMPGGFSSFGVYCGVWEFGKFVGVIIFGKAATTKLGEKYGLKENEVCELTRIALKKHYYPVSKMMKFAFKKLKEKCPVIKLIVSFADPDQNHHGGVYQAGNWIYSGTSAPTKFVMVNGKMKHPRWAKNGRKISKPGKHRYLMPLDNDVKNRVLKLNQKYPKRATSIVSDAVSDQDTKGGAIPTVALQSDKKTIGKSTRVQGA